MRLVFHTLDVFTQTRFGGNPVAVVHDADRLDAGAMQRIAREFNLSETVFVLAPQNAAHSARLRIFTPFVEMPFAGHPTLGAAASLAELKAAGDGEEREALLALEEGIGIVRVGVRLRQGGAFAEFDAPRLPEEMAAPSDIDGLAAMLGLIPSEIAFENHRPTVFGAGNAFLFVPVRTLEAIAKARVIEPRWSAYFSGRQLVGAFLYTRQTVHTTSAFHARMFAPHFGVPEDPATGSAAAAFAGVVHRFDELPSGTHRRVIEQGYEMGRPSEIALSLITEGARLTTVRIGGHAVRVSEGTIES
jgi:trans-2,3-dihydro-3-hydroxyanthranilate isomerase